MPLQTQNWNNPAGAPPTGPAWPTNPNVHLTEIQNAIGAATAVDFFGALGPTSVVNVHGWRIDRQNAPAGFTNVSVQRNGVPAPSTVATVFVPANLNIAPGPGGPAAQPFAARVAELERAVRRGLEESLATWVAAVPGQPAHITRRVVTGAFSA